MSDVLLDGLRESVGALLGDVIETTAPVRSPLSLDKYRGQPVAFLREVLGMRLLAWQVAWLDGPFATSALNVILSCNGAGKTGLMSALLIYLAAVGQSTAIYYSASEKQTRSQMTVELRRRLRETRLATTIYNHGCAFAGGGAILLLAVGEANSLQGFHGNVTIIADEAQALDGDSLGAFMGCIVGDDDRLILCGNALGLGTTFHQITQNRDVLWRQTVVTAPEVIADPEAAHIAGLITKKGVDQLRQTFGQEHWQFQARVYSRFAKRSADAMFPEAEVLAAFARWHDPVFRASQQRKALTLGVDVAASLDGDESIIAIARGGYVQKLEAFREPDTMKTVGIVVSLFKRLSVRRNTSPHLAAENALLERGLGGLLPVACGDPIETHGSNPATIRVDEIGVGKGVGDRLREAGYSCEAFIASRRPESVDGGERYANVRAEAADRLRSLIVRGIVAFPPDDKLQEELLTCQQVITSSGKLQIWSKKEWKKVIGRSCDRLDACIISVAGTGAISFDTALSEAGLAVMF